MKIIRLDKTKAIQRDDGRTIKELCRYELGMEVNNLNFIYVRHPANFQKKSIITKTPLKFSFFWVIQNI